MRRTVGPLALAALIVLGAAVGMARAQTQAADPANWNQVTEAARGETVYFNAWAGDDDVNDYIRWVAGEVKDRFGITLQHVKIDDTANAVARVLAEKAAGRDTEGSVDLIWINGENFAAMKEAGLLAEGFAAKLPNWRYVDTSDPTVTTDFGVPTEGQESPWGSAKLVFYTDTARSGPIEGMPGSAQELLAWAKENPGRFTYPAPPDFMGSSFLKQVLIETSENPAVLQRPAGAADFEAVTAPLWAWLDEIHPALWRQGRDFPENYSALKQLLADGAIGIAFAFNPAEASSAIAAGELPETVRSFVFPGGTLGNTHFVAIPYNSGAKAAAMVVANFLISPEAQLRKEDPRYWGDPTVLSLDRLEEADRAAFKAIERGPATLAPDELGPVLPEPHPSWMTRIEDEWERRYGS